jgi:hypothetical protein
MVGFHDIVQAYFTQVTGRLVMFSGRDIALMQQWRARGATAANICCGVRDAVLSMEEGADPPRSLYNCKAYIEPYVLRATERMVGDAEQAAQIVQAVLPVTARSLEREREQEQVRYAAHVRKRLRHALGAVERAGHKLKDEALRQVYREVWYQLRAMQKVDIAQQPQILAELELLDERLAERWYAALDESVRERVDARVREEGAQLMRRLSPEAWQRWCLMRRRRVLEELGLVSLVDAALL